MAVLNAAAPRATIATVDATGERGRWSVHSRGALEGDTSLAADISVLLDRGEPAAIDPDWSLRRPVREAGGRGARSPAERTPAGGSRGGAARRAGDSGCDAHRDAGVAAARGEAHRGLAHTRGCGARPRRGAGAPRGPSGRDHPDDGRSFRQSTRRTRDGDGRQRSDPSRRGRATRSAGGPRCCAPGRVAAIRIARRLRDAGRIAGRSAAGGANLRFRPRCERDRHRLARGRRHLRARRPECDRPSPESWRRMAPARSRDRSPPGAHADLRTRGEARACHCGL